MAITPRKLRFVVEYLSAADQNGAEAYRRVFKSKGTPHTCSEEARRILADPEIAQIVAAHRRRVIDGLVLGADDLTRMWSQIATTDRNEIAEVRRVCCRFCYTPNDDPQETRYERAARKKAHDRACKEALAKAPHGTQLIVPDFDELGGAGYDPRKPINPNCGQCFGDGEERVYTKDTRTLSPEARAVYEGVDIKNGNIVVKMFSREKATELVAKRLGILGDKQNPGPLGGDTPAALPDDPHEAAAVYRRMVTRDG